MQVAGCAVLLCGVLCRPPGAPVARASRGERRGCLVGGARARARARSVEPLADEERKAPPVRGVGVVAGGTVVFCHAGRGVRGVALVLVGAS